jgi:glycolate oxidase iron-sulfur subunit
VITDPLLREADRCVKCGLCLPHCPTYQEYTDEAESPRGRIALIQAYLTDEIPYSQQLKIHLDHCLGCRACERACPSGVAYGALIDGIRGELATREKDYKGLLPRWLLNQLTDQTRFGKLNALLELMRPSGLLAVAHKFTKGQLQSMLSITSLIPREGIGPGLYPSSRPAGKRVHLFTGCVGSIADSSAIKAAREVLQQLGYAVEISAKQQCCGALHRHNGDPQTADRFCADNRELFSKQPTVPLITLASACHLELQEYLGGNLPVRNIEEFLLESAPLNLRVLNARVALHIPCTMPASRTQELLHMIPGLEVIELPENNICCGAAGGHIITQPELASALGEKKLQHLKHDRPDILVTSNTGCALQFRKIIAEAGLQIQVLHPVELIQRQLEANPRG